MFDIVLIIIVLAFYATDIIEAVGDTIVKVKRANRENEDGHSREE